MNNEEMQGRLDAIEKALTAKGHPMQDFSTVKQAMLDLIEVIRNLVPTEKKG